MSSSVLPHSVVSQALPVGWGSLLCFPLLQVVKHLKGIEDRLVHVEVLVGGQPPHKGHAFLLRGQLGVLLIELPVGRVGHGVVGFPLGGGELPGDQRALHLALLHLRPSPTLPLPALPVQPSGFLDLVRHFLAVFLVSKQKGALPQWAGWGRACTPRCG